jgi:hypothetical protein
MQREKKLYKGHTIKRKRATNRNLYMYTIKYLLNLMIANYLTKEPKNKKFFMLFVVLYFSIRGSNKNIIN